MSTTDTRNEAFSYLTFSDLSTGAALSDAPVVLSVFDVGSSKITSC
jgi:hypothetical protein